jgi:hypothetical protein
MKTIIKSIVDVLAKALGPAVGVGGIITETEWAQASGAVVTLLTVAATVWMRRREQKALSARTGAEVAAKLSATARKLPLLALLLAGAAAGAGPGCTLTPAQRETASRAVVALVKAGVLAGLNAVAANNPEYSAYVEAVRTGVNILFERVDDATPASELADAIGAVIEDAARASGGEDAAAARRDMTAAVTAGILAATGATQSITGSAVESPTTAKVITGYRSGGASDLYYSHGAVAPRTTEAVTGINVSARLRERSGL